MILSRRVALDGVQLDGLDARILIGSVTEGDPKYTVNASARCGSDGQRVTVYRRDSLDITVKFGLRIRKDNMQARAELLERVAQWAAPGGWLTLGHRPGRRLRVICAQPPGQGDQYEWNKDYQIVFRALAVPYWQDTDPASFSIATSRTTTRALGVPGMAPSALEFALANTSSDTLNNFTISAAGLTMAFEQLGLASGETMEMDHDDDGLLRIRIKSAAGVWRSAMAKRTAASADELIVSPGSVPISWTCGKTCQLTVRCYGRYA